LGARENAGVATNSTRPINASFQSGDINPFLQRRENVFRPGSKPDSYQNSVGGNDPYGNNNQRQRGVGIFQNPTLELEAQRQAQSNPLWNSPFAQPPQVQPDPQQAASMERFRALLDSAPASAPDLAAPNQPIAVRRVDPNMEVMPAFNPAGNSFVPLQTVTSTRPAGLIPLSGPETRRPQPAPPKPTWTPKLPPWLSKEQNPQTPLQRVF
jgi:hypothetical protein